MNLLRKEIEKYMEKLLHDPGGTFTYDVPLITDEILNMFEKRIDDKIDKALNNEQIIVLMSVKDMLK